jgi:hypothetical protein
MAEKKAAARETPKTLPPKGSTDSETQWADPWAATAEARGTVYGRETFPTDLRTLSQKITTQINRDPQESARLKESRAQARAGKRSKRERDSKFS